VPVSQSLANVEPSGEVEQAARTLRDLYASLRQARSSGEEIKGVVRNIGAGQNEPYI